MRIPMFDCNVNRIFCRVTLLSALAFSGLAQADISTGLVAHFPFEGNANDASGNNNHGIIRGNISFVDGPVKKAARFNGVNSVGGTQNPDHIFIPNSSTLQFSNAMSVSYWVKFSGNRSQTYADCSGETVTSTNGVVLGKSGDRNGFYFGEEDTSSGFAINQYNGGDGIGSANTQLKSASSAFRHVAYVMNGSSMSLYVDGALINTKSGQLNFSASNSRDMYIGTQYNRGGACLDFWGQLDGIVDELRIYNKPLSADDVKQLSQEKGGAFTANSLDGHYVADVVKADGNVYLLTSVRTSPEAYLTNPDGTRSYLSDVYLLKIDSAYKLSKTKLATLYAFGDSPTFNVGDLMVSGSTAYVFHNGSVRSGSYTMNGYLYTVNTQSMGLQGSRTVFTNANWGWYPVIQSANSVSHFSFAGYYRMLEGVNQGSVQPELMANLAIKNRVDSAGGLFNSDELTQINGSFRPTFIQRLMPNSIANYFSCPDRSGLPSSVLYSDGRLCLPITNIPTGDGQYATFYTLWQSSNPSASNAIFRIIDAKAYTSSITSGVPSPVFYDPATNSVEVSYPESNFAKEKFTVLLDLPLGLQRVSSSPVPAPQSCPAQALSWSVGSQSCSASASTTSSGQAIQLTNSSGSNTGSAAFTCTNGTWSAASSATCTALQTNRAPSITSIQVTSTPQCTNGCSGYTYQGGADVKVTFIAADPDGDSISTKFNIYAGANKFWVGGLTDPIQSSSGSSVTSGTMNTGGGNSNYGAYVGLMYACLVPTDSKSEQGQQACQEFYIPTPSSVPAAPVCNPAEKKC